MPLELGWTFSVHRSQGMSLDRVQMSLANVFEVGQAVRDDENTHREAD